jgi:hypothetical protein
LYSLAASPVTPFLHAVSQHGVVTFGLSPLKIHLLAIGVLRQEVATRYVVGLNPEGSGLKAGMETNTEYEQQEGQAGLFKEGERGDGRTESNFPYLAGRHSYHQISRSLLITVVASNYNDRTNPLLC